MNSPGITLLESRLNYRPGEVLRGTARWDCERSPKRAEVRLCWFTDGIPIHEASLVETRIFVRPAPCDTQPFEFRLPSGPYSYRGRLTALEWALELVVFPIGATHRVVFSLSPTGTPLRLGPEESCPQPVPPKLAYVKRSVSVTS